MNAKNIAEKLVKEMGYNMKEVYRLDFSQQELLKGRIQYLLELGLEFSDDLIESLVTFNKEWTERLIKDQKLLKEIKVLTVILEWISFGYYTVKVKSEYTDWMESNMYDLGPFSEVEGGLLFFVPKFDYPEDGIIFREDNLDFVMATINDINVLLMDDEAAKLV